MNEHKLQLRYLLHLLPTILHIPVNICEKLNATGEGLNLTKRFLMMKQYSYKFALLGKPVAAQAMKSVY